MSTPIYLDNHATTRTDPRVFAKMAPYFTEHYGNAASRSHAFGWAAEEAVQDARAQTAAAIGASPREIVFTSGATESNNLAIAGLALANQERGRHLISTRIEHKAVLDTLSALERQGFEVTRLGVDSDGRISLQALEAALRDDTTLVSVMHANNEIGVIQPIAEVGALCRARGIAFHTDAAQSIGKIPFDVAALPVDLVSLSGHKVYGPKGIGALYVRRTHPRLRIRPLMYGGGHENGLRSGTLAVPLIVGLGEALRLAVAERDEEAARLVALRERLWAGLSKRLTDLHLNGHPALRLPGNLNVSFRFVEGEALLMGLQDIAVSSGSACTSASLEPSYVLGELGVSEMLAYSAIRFGIGRFNTESEIDTAIDKTVCVVNRLREMSPLWQMKVRGEDPTALDWEPT